MLTRSKVLISLLIFFIIASVTYYFIFYFKVDLKFVNFINNHLEAKYQSELEQVSHQIERQLTILDKKINTYLKDFDFSKFTSKTAARRFDLNDENQLSSTFLSNELLLKKIKLINNNKEILFSTDEKERIRRANYINFVSVDNIENDPALFQFGDKIPFLFNMKDNQIILKKNIIHEQKKIGVMLFYFTDGVFNNLLRNLDFYHFENIHFFYNEYILLNKPDRLLTDSLNLEVFASKNDTLHLESQSDQEKEVENTDKTESLKYKVFQQTLNDYQLNIFTIENYSLFIMNKIQTFIVLLLLLTSIYLLILFLILLKRSQLDKAKERLSLFTAALMEEMIGAKSREELENLYDNIYEKKQFILKNLFLNFSKLKDAEKKSLEEEIDVIIKKIETAIGKQIETSYEDNIAKMEQMLNNFISTISEQGIKVKGAISSKKITSPDTVEELEEVEELEDAEAVEELEEVEELEDAEAVEELEEAEELEDAEAVEELEEAEELENAEAVEELEEAEELENAEAVEELEEAEELDDAEAVDELEEVEELSEDEISELSQEDIEGEALAKMVPLNELENELEGISDEMLEREHQPDRIKNGHLPEPEDLSITADIGTEIESTKHADSDVDVYLIGDKDSENKKYYLEELFNDDKSIDNQLKLKLMDYVNELTSLENFPEIIKDDEEPPVEDIQLSQSKETPEPAKKTDQEQEIGHLPAEEELLEELDELEELEELEELDEAEILEDNEIPTIPDEYYNVDSKKDQLAENIKKLELKKTPLQKLLDELYQNTKANKLSLMIQLNDRGSFIQTYQIGFGKQKVQKYILDTNNLIVHHIYLTERVVYVSEINKLSSLFHNKNFENEFVDIESLIIYPVKIFKKIRALVFLGFEQEAKDKLENFIDFIQSNNYEIRKNITKIV
ncbi:MAG: hypothetical protein MJB14_14360 [Spirochaetes bacterium]|nr:hypothetical protein [Spirochaetota bacterium]